jgi:peptide/nickel transport system substrate-binding protein/oligopeptide transport system substrate-binding protein
LGYNEEPVNKLLSEARACGDEQERLTLYQQVNRMVGLDMPVLPLVYDRLHVACSERVASLAIDPVGRQHCAKAQLKA